MFCFSVHLESCNERIQLPEQYCELPCYFSSGNKTYLTPLIRITLGQHKSDNINRMIQLTDVFCLLLIYKWASKSLRMTALLWLFHLKYLCNFKISLVQLQNKITICSSISFVLRRNLKFIWEFHKYYKSLNSVWLFPDICRKLWQSDATWVVSSHFRKRLCVYVPRISGNM